MFELIYIIYRLCILLSENKNESLTMFELLFSVYINDSSFLRDVYLTNDIRLDFHLKKRITKSFVGRSNQS